MLAALKEIFAIVALIVTVAISTGNQEWLYKQISTLRKIATQETRRDWGCPSVFDKYACNRIKF